MKKILVVEDEVAIREFEVINLRRVGYETVEAGSGEEALAVYEEHGDIDIALLDISMPGMDGLTLCKELRRRSPALGIIMLTARAQEMDKIHGLMIGADDYITKPFSPTELLARVDSLYRRVDMGKATAAKESADEIRLGEFTLNVRRRTLSSKGREILLAAKNSSINTKAPPKNKMTNNILRIYLQRISRKGISLSSRSMPLIITNIGKTK